ncbi:SRPBCC family protein [Acidaminobacter sp. JC074]|uniref:SRPBCC family protein n=1 Tax=Acidaminobacter sp. JC074 TaxID=2530199 RepID=UPI001F0F3E78|nr:SRPBCC family protein [Acidaminobacter sp. JC074]MCH4887603.1 SRPBCC family protein [Acidaminobacter sp. JC074]
MRSHKGMVKKIFKGSMQIKKPISEVTEKFLDPESIRHYQDGFMKKEMRLGNVGQEDSVAMLYYKKMAIEETVLINQLPKSYVALYHHKDRDYMIRSSFESVDENTTRFDYEYEYIRLSHRMDRWLLKLYPDFYKNNVDKWTEKFKEYVEKS